MRTAGANPGDMARIFLVADFNNRLLLEPVGLGGWDRVESLLKRDSSVPILPAQLHIPYVSFRSLVFKFADEFKTLLENCTYFKWSDFSIFCKWQVILTQGSIIFLNVLEWKCYWKVFVKFYINFCNDFCHNNYLLLNIIFSNLKNTE